MGFWGKLKQFAGELFSNWAFTDKGIAFFAAVWGVIMGTLTYLTHSLEIFAPFSYGLMVVLGLIIGLHLCRLFNNVFSAKYTDKPTFVEYKMEKGRINLLGKSNIWGEPSFGLGIRLNQESVPIQANSQRNQRRAEKNHPPVYTEHELKTATVQVIFDKPIAPRSFHVHLVKGVGPCPVRMVSNIHSRGALVELHDLANDCSFHLWFNEEKK